MSENYKRILTFKRDQGGSFQFRLFSVIIVTSVNVRAFVDFCLRYKHFYWIDMKVRVWWSSEPFGFLVGQYNTNYFSFKNYTGEEPERGKINRQINNKIIEQKRTINYKKMN